MKGGALGSFFHDGVQVLNVRAIATTVDNAVGAGDVYNAGVVAGYLNGRDLLGSLVVATAAASLYVGRRVDRFPSYQECVELAKRVEVVALDS